MVLSLLQLFWDNIDFVHWDLHYNNLQVNPFTGEIKLFDFDLSEVYNSVSMVKYSLGREIDMFIEEASDKACLINFNIKLLGHYYDYYRFILEPRENHRNLSDHIIDNIIPEEYKNDGSLSNNKKIVFGLKALHILNPTQILNLHAGKKMHFYKD